MAKIKWILDETVLAIHKRQIAEHGGIAGIRDENLLSSALARPQNFEAYGENVEIPQLAAAYAFGIAKNHPFLDGNKRTAFVVMRTFLLINGYDIEATQEEKYITFIKLAEGELSEEELVEWIKSKLILVKN